LWSLALSGGKPSLLTPGQGVEDNPRFTGGGFLTYLADNRERHPPQLMIRGPHAQPRTLVSLSAEASRHNEKVWEQFAPEEPVSVRAEDGITTYHMLIKPKSPPPAGGYPVIVAAHGGPEDRTWPGSHFFVFGQYVASRGYLFVDINYRGSTGFGLDYRLPDGRGATGGSEVKDLAALAQYLKSRGDVNPKRVGIMGASYGGHIVGLAMSRLPDDFAAGVSLFGVSDWVVEMKKDETDDGTFQSAPPPFIRLSERTQIEELAYASSPSAQIEHWRGPTLLTEGDLDRQGHMESTIDLGYQLLAHGVPVEFYIDPAGGHNVFPQQRVFDFFAKNLH
jgi:dipeptidyl aminopeptidase/acylaminoacyl peptidase